MKLTIAWIFSFITFIGVMSQDRNSCAESLSSKQTYSTVASATVQHQNYQHEDLNEDGKKDSGCHHSNSTCRNCHLGHCAFTLGSSLLFSTFNPPQVLTFTTVDVIIFDFQTSPFRPPIA